MKRNFLLGLILSAGMFTQAEASWCQPCNTEPEWCEAPCSPPPCAPVCDNSNNSTYYDGNYYPSNGGSSGGGYGGGSSGGYGGGSSGGYGGYRYGYEFDNGWGSFGFFGQFLWWGLYGEELDYGAINTHAPTNLAETAWDNDCETLEHTFDWKPGVRLGIFYQSPNSGPDVAFEWTYYYNSSSQRYTFLPPALGGITVNSVYLLEPSPSFLVAPGELSGVTLASSTNFRFNHFIVKYGDVVDWDCGFSFHPYVGPVFYQADQDISVAMAAIGSDPVTADLQSIQVKTTTNAIGAKLGTDFSYNLFDGFTLICDLGISGVAADFKLDGALNTTFSGEPIATTYDFSVKKWQARALLDLSLGFRYSTCFCGCYHVFAQIEWEYHQLFNQTNFLLKDMSIPSPSAVLFGRGVKGFTRSTADLMMHGLSVSAGFAF